MEYYSTKTKQLYKEIKDLEEAEKAYDEREAVEKAKRDQRKERAKEVQDAYNKYQELLKAFFKDYGYYYEIKDGNSVDLFDIVFNWPFIK